MTAWHRAAALSELEQAKPRGVVLRPEAAPPVPILLVRLGEEVFALRDECSHVGAPLCDGRVEGFELECPWHYARFDLRSGEPLAGPADEPVSVYPVRVEDGLVLVSLE